MKLAASMLLAGLLLAFPVVSAQDSGVSAFTLVGKADLKWYLEGETAANPTITVAPSTEITITMKQEGDIPHNIQVGDNAVSGITEADGDTLEYKFMAPASGTLTYICKLHGTPMSGTLVVAGTKVEEPKESPGFAVIGLTVALLGAALILRRK